jgi:hypothetical protein
MQPNVAFVDVQTPADGGEEEEDADTLAPWFSPNDCVEEPCRDDTTEDGGGDTAL